MGADSVPQVHRQVCTQLNQGGLSMGMSPCWSDRWGLLAEHFTLDTM